MATVKTEVGPALTMTERLLAEVAERSWPTSAPDGYATAEMIAKAKNIAYSRVCVAMKHKGVSFVDVKSAQNMRPLRWFNLREALDRGAV